MPSIEKRGSNSWRLIVEEGYDSNGKRVQQRKTVRIEDDEILRSKRRLHDYLQSELVKFRQEVESGQFVKPERTTFAEFISIWKTNYANLHLGPLTRKNYMAIINARLIPTFGHLEMHKLKTMHIVSFMSSLKAPESRRDGRNKPLATNTLLNIYKTLKSIFDAASRWKIISQNPIDGVDRPLADKQEKRALKSKKHSYTTAEAKKLILELRDEPRRWQMYYLGILLGGIHIMKQISLTEDGKRTEAEVKTEESVAFVPMPKWYLAELAQFKKQWSAERLKLGDKWKGGNLQYII
jgi:integrase